MGTIDEYRPRGANSSLNNSAIDNRNKTFDGKRGNMNKSFAAEQLTMNKSMVQQGKLDGRLMSEKKKNVIQSRENVSVTDSNLILLIIDGVNEEQNRGSETQS